MKHSFKLIALLICMVIIVAACSENSNNNSSNQSSATNTPAPVETSTPAPEVPEVVEPFDISWMTTMFTTEQLNANDSRLAELQKMTNTKLDIQWIPSATYDTKLTASIAANDLPTIVTVPNVRNAVITNAAKSDVFWELGQYIDDYPNLSRMNKGVLQGTMIDGGIYGLYRERPLSRDAVIIRQDWLDKLGLPLPKTIEDLYNVAKAFTNDDPDGNNQNDTFGFTASGGVSLTSFLNIYFGGHNAWGIENDSVVPDFQAPEYLQALNWSKRLYSEKLINQDFIVANSSQAEEYFASSKAGIYITVYNVLDRTLEPLQKLVPTAEVSLITMIDGPKGNRTIGGAGHQGVNMIPKSAVKTEEDLKKVLAFLDAVNSEEGQNILRWGILGTDYEIVNNQTKDLTTDATHFSSYRQLRMLEDKMIPAELTGLKARYAEVEAENTKIAILNPTVGLESQTLSELGGSLSQIIDDARNKFILSDIDEEGFKKAVDTWYSTGGSKVVEEFNAAYKVQLGN